MLFLKVDEDIELKILETYDAAELFNLVQNNRSYLRKWVPWVDGNVSAGDSMAFIKLSQEQHKQNLGFQCGIRYRGRLAGVIGFVQIDWPNKNTEIGYWIDEKHQGLGIITKSCRTMINYAFEELRLHRVQIRSASENKKSCDVIERLGLIKEGVARQAEFLYDHFVDLNIYGITEDEWKIREGIALHRNEA
ncbi:MAG: GNAT family N-acetyltransferase [Bacteroidetes bacterium]|nr:GNAT family N-acetyltransferase [Bacteroidota bacterium]